MRWVVLNDVGLALEKVVEVELEGILADLRLERELL